MIIDRFGSTYSSAFQLSQYNAIDSYGAERPAVTSRVGGMNGEFDYYGSNNYPIGKLLVSKSMSLVGKWEVTTGTGTIGMEAGDGLVVGIGTLFLSEVHQGDIITADGQAHTVLTVTDNTHLTATNPQEHIGDTFTISHVNPTRNGVEVTIDAIKAATIAVGESKLWALRRDGVKHWAWAKCTKLVTADQVGNVYHLPATIEFVCREGVWYAETQSGTSIVHTDLSYDLVNAGNVSAAFELTITSSADTLTAVTITNTTNGDTFTWAGSATVGQTIIVKTGSYLVTKAGAGAYSGLTYGANQINWLRLNPGTNTVTISVTGSTAWSGSMAWWDTYL